MQNANLAPQPYKNIPVLVTGGAGFIGSHIAEKLVALGANVTIIDNLSSGSLENLATIKDKVTFINASIEDFKACMHATENKSIVFHLAAMISVPESIKNPDACFATNSTGTLNLLEACKRNGVERFVLSSSSAVYGPSDEPCNEKMVCHPESPYGVSKLVAESACRAYFPHVGCVCLRYFNVYGERQNPNGEYAAVVAKFKHQMRNSLPITIFGDGMQTRDFISVNKVVEANLQLALLDHHEMNGPIFNIANGKSVTLLELVEQLKTEFPNYQKALLFKPARPGDIYRSIADTNKWEKIQENFI